MKKATAAPAPPPPPPSSAMVVMPRPASGSSSVTGDSDSASVESGLEGRMRLSIVLPDGTTVPMEVERRTAMMDLLVLVTKANNLNPGSHALDVKSNETVSYKPNTPIGTVGVSAVHVVPRARDPNSIHRDSKSGTKPFEKTFRLRVHLPRNQLHVLRVSPRTPLAEVFEAICTDRGLTPSRYELRHPIHEEVRLEHARCLADYDLSEVALVAVKDSTGGGSLKHPDPIETASVVASQEHAKKKHGILSFMFKRNKSMDVGRRPEPLTSSVYRDASRTECGPLPTTTAAVAPSSPSSASDMSASSNKSLKKRLAPPPPCIHARQSSLPTASTTTTTMTTTNAKSPMATGDGLTTFAASHSRHSSDSSGYHESSILGDSPEITGVDLECAAQLHFKGRKAASTTNIHLIDSTSSLSMSMSGGGNIKKRKAPPPPPPLRSSTLPPPTSKPSAASMDAVERPATSTELLNGSLGPSTVSRQESSSNQSSSSTENEIEVASDPVPKPRQVQPSTSEVDDGGCNGHDVMVSSTAEDIEERFDEKSTDEIENGPTNASRHSSSSSVATSDKADSVKSIEEDVVDSRTADDVHDKNLKNARKSSVDLNDSSSTSEDRNSDEVEREQTVLADAINEFHNEINSGKLNLTDLWSQVVTLPPPPPADEAQSKDIDNINDDDDVDKLSIGETNYFDMPDEDRVHKDDSHGEDSSAKLDDIHSDNQKSLVNGVLNEHVSCERDQMSNNVTSEGNVHEDDEDVVVVVVNGLAEVAKSDDLLQTREDSNAVDNDLVVTWEYRIPEVPVEFQNDPRDDEAQSEETVAESFGPTKSLTTVYVSKEDDNVATAAVTRSSHVVKVVEQDRKVVVQEKGTNSNRVYGRRPVVQFSISTYRNRATEETSYREKLVRVESLEPPSSTKESSAEVEPSDDTRDVVDGTRSTKKCRSEILEPNAHQTEPSEDRPAKDEIQLQEEYSKLHQQFLQWQKQLMNNQTMLQKQQVLPESTTNSLRPLQDMQEQFASLPPPTKKLQQPEVEVRKSATATSGLRPSRPFSVDLYPWNRRGSRVDNDGCKSLELTDTIERKSSTMDQRKPSFNEQRPVVTINRQSSSAACFPRHPVVRGFATLPSTTSSHFGPATDGTKKCVKTVTYFGDPVHQRSEKPDMLVGRQPRSVSQIQLRNVYDHVPSKQSEDVLAIQSSAPSRVNGNSKFSTVVSVGHATKNRQLSSYSASPPPPPPPPQPPQSQTASLPKVARTKPRTANLTSDPKEELMSAIRDFGGRFGLKKVSTVETRWQSRHGNVI